VRDFIAKAKEAATGEAVIRSVRPADQVVKITYDGLVEMLGGEDEAQGLNLSLNPPTVILMAGLQGSGKTTTAAKLGLKLGKERKKVLLASLDTRRPRRQRSSWRRWRRWPASRACRSSAGQAAPDIARRALQSAKLQGMTWSSSTPPGAPRSTRR
jgi:signal recognition particle subunit SRP54